MNARRDRGANKHPMLIAVVIIVGAILLIVARTMMLISEKRSTSDPFEGSASELNELRNPVAPTVPTTRLGAAPAMTPPMLRPSSTVSGAPSAQQNPAGLSAASDGGDRGPVPSIAIVRRAMRRILDFRFWMSSLGHSGGPGVQSTIQNRKSKMRPHLSGLCPSIDSWETSC